MNKITSLASSFLLISSLVAYSQNVGINAIGATPNNSAILDLNTGNTFTSPNGKGLLPTNVPLTSITDVVTVTSPATSLLIYNTATAGSGTAAIAPGYYYWDGTQWVSFKVSVPTGIIVMWSGSVGSIPSGWAFCDGTNSTPDLRDRFILASGTTNAVASTGGNNNVTLTIAELPAHLHTGTTTNDGNHFHTQGANSAGVFYSAPLPAELNTGLASGSQFADAGASGISRGGFQTSITGNHNHTFTTDAMPAATSFDNRPAYYTLAYIMKL